MQAAPAGGDAPLVAVSRVVRSPLVDRAGEPLGRVDDLIVRLSGRETYPPITGLKARIGGRQLFIPIDRIAELVPGRVRLTGETLNLQRFERRPGEVLLREDVLDRQVINVELGSLIAPRDIELSAEGGWRVVGVDPGSRGLLSRLLPGRRGTSASPADLMDWSHIVPFVGHVPTARLLLPLRRLKKLHPAQIADLVEAASHAEGEEIIGAVSADPELEADVFEELDPHHQLEFLRARSDQEAAEVLAKMGPDDAADLIAELDQERRLPVLILLPQRQQAKVRSLLAYNPSTAGGLMSPDFLTVDTTATVSEALAEVRRSPLPPPVLQTVYVLDADRRLVGSVPVVALVRARPECRIEEVIEPVSARLRPDSDFHEVVRLMTDYNLTGAPVVNDEDCLLGVVAVDDVLEELQPARWRQRAGVAAGA